MTEKSFVDFDKILQVGACRHDRKKFRWFWSNFTGPRLSTWPKKSFVDFDQILQVRACRHDRKKVSSILIKFYRSAPVDMTEKKFRRFWSNFTGPRLSTWPKKKVSSILIKFYRSAPVDMTEKKFRRFWSNFTGPHLSTWPKKSSVDFDQILQVRACQHDRKKVSSILIKFYKSAPVDMTE